MDTLPADVLLQILVKTDSRTLQLIIPQLSEDVKQQLNRPAFWQARFQFCWSVEKLPAVEKFEQATGVNGVHSASRASRDLACRLVEYSALNECHLVLAALAMHQFPSLEVITAALALVQGPLLTPKLRQLDTSVKGLARKTHHKLLSEDEGGRLDPRAEDEDVLTAQLLNCCRHNPQHLGRVLSYLCRCYPTIFYNVQRLIEGLFEDSDNLMVVLETMDDCKAWHAQTQFLFYLIDKCRSQRPRREKLLEALIAYASRQHYYDMLMYLHVTFCGSERPDVFLRRLLEQYAPGIAAITVAPDYYSTNFSMSETVDYQLPPSYKASIFPLPLMGAPVVGIKKGSPVGRSIFDYPSYQLVEFMSRGINVLDLLRKEARDDFSYAARSMRYSGVVALYRLAFQEDPDEAREIFGSEILRASLNSVWGHHHSLAVYFLNRTRLG